MATVSNMSLRDVDQITKYEHEDVACAKRVFVVGGDFKLDIDPSQITNAVKEGLQTIEIKGIQSMSSKEIQTIEIPTIIKETEIKIVEVEKPIIQQEVKIVEVEKAVIQEQIKIVEIEKPIFIPSEQKVVIIEVPKIVEKIVEKVSPVAISIIIAQVAVIAFLILK
jgi:hypothetical protein